MGKRTPRVSTNCLACVLSGRTIPTISPADAVKAGKVLSAAPLWISSSGALVAADRSSGVVRSFGSREPDCSGAGTAAGSSNTAAIRAAEARF
ncbi:hypothetical protein PJL18_03171 [Paenarthrobacter nicotinovorans]|nr:hypothetical protein [Paenarthrobacter nicotinovorans]